MSLKSEIDYFFRDDVLLENNFIEIVRSDLNFSNLIADSGFLFESRKFNVIFRQSLIYFRTSLGSLGFIQFKYFFNSTSTNLNLSFIDTKLNIMSFDFIFFIQKSESASSVYISNLKMNKDFSGCLLFLKDLPNNKSFLNYINK